MSLHTPLCDLLNIQVPIIQAGMGWDKEGMTTPPELVAAVSNAGGLGCIGGSSIRPEVIRERIRAVRKLTERPFGVDITLPKMEDVKIPDPDEVRKEIEEKYPQHAKFTDQLIPKLGLAPQPPDRKSWVKTPAATREQLKVILEENVPILIIGLGDTAEVVPLAHHRGIKVMALAGAVKHALSHARKGADVIIAQGYEAGGHTGTIGNFPLIPQIVDAVRPKPVVAAGGISDGRGVVARSHWVPLASGAARLSWSAKSAALTRCTRNKSSPAARRILSVRPIPAAITHGIIAVPSSKHGSTRGWTRCRHRIREMRWMRFAARPKPPSASICCTCRAVKSRGCSPRRKAPGRQKKSSNGWSVRQRKF